MEPPKLAEELKRMGHEPLLPAEKRLIGWSLALGFALILLLVGVNQAFFRS
jgi:hypothetical protein